MWLNMAALALCLASATVAVYSRRLERVGIALGMHLLSLCLVILLLGSGLVAVVMALAAVGVVVVALSVAAQQRGEVPHKPPLALDVLLAAVSLLLLIVLAVPLLESYVPGEANVLRETHALGDWRALVDHLFARYGLGMLGVGLMALVAVVGIHRHGGEH